MLLEVPAALGDGLKSSCGQRVWEILGDKLSFDRCIRTPTPTPPKFTKVIFWCSFLTKSRFTKLGVFVPCPYFLGRVATKAKFRKFSEVGGGGPKSKIETYHQKDGHVQRGTERGHRGADNIFRYLSPIPLNSRKLADSWEANFLLFLPYFFGGSTCYFSATFPRFRLEAQNGLSPRPTESQASFHEPAPRLPALDRRNLAISSPQQSSCRTPAACSRDPFCKLRSMKQTGVSCRGGLRYPL